MKLSSLIRLSSLVLCLTLSLASAPARADSASDVDLAKLEAALDSVARESSEPRQRLMVRRAIRDAEKAVAEVGAKPERWRLLEFLFRAQRNLVSMDEDKAHREALLATCRELVKAPNEFAEYRLEADLLLSQVEQVKHGASKQKAAEALRRFVERYVGTPVVGKALRAATVIALEHGDARLIADLRDQISMHCGGDYEMVSFQRDHMGGQVFGAPFAGSFKRSDGKLVRLPMDCFGRSAIVLFWSNEGEGVDYARGIANAYQRLDEDMAGRVEIISMNLDELPDAGESVIRGFGVNWQCLHLPGGREHPAYKSFARRDPFPLRVSSTGQAALIMDGLQRIRVKEDGSVDYEAFMNAAFSNPWAVADYCMQLRSLSAGEFLIFDPEEILNPALPPELKAVPTPKPLGRDDKSVPLETLLSIQACFVSPATCYQSSHVEVLANYRKAVELCHKAIAEHADAPDLWVVRNRLIVALMGLWKSESDLTHLEEAFVAAREAVDAGYPAGCDLVARFCLAREALRSPQADSAAIMEDFVARSGGDQAPGPALAAAASLSLDVADRVRFERYRALILRQHAEHPMMWLYASSLLDRHHDYWRFQVPFYVGYSYPHRERNFKERGEVEGAHRLLKSGLLKPDGSIFRIPEDLTADYTAIFFTLPGPWDEKGLASLPASPFRAVTGFASATADRPTGKVQTILTVLADQPLSEVTQDRNGREIRHPFAMMALPGGVGNPLVHRLGLLFDQGGLNSVLLDKQGRVLCMISGIARSTTISENALINVLNRQDALKVDGLLAKGQLDEAKQFIRALAPEEAPDKYSSDSIRARARVYRASGELDKALADIKELINRQQSVAERTSEKSAQHEADEVFRDEIIGLMKGVGK